jgi:glycosyltransferase involved in cell wall biosynthesis
MKIAYIALKGMPLGGGIEKYTEELGSRLVQRGHEIIVYCSSYYNTNSKNYKGMRIKIMPSINTKSFQKPSLTLFSSLNQFIEKNLDIVHYHAVGPSLFSFMPRFIGRKTVVQIHGLEWMRPKWGAFGRAFFKFNDLTAVYFPNKVTAVSKFLKNYYERKFGREVIYIPTGVNKPVIKKPEKMLELGLTGNDYVFFASRLVPDKGCHYLIDAFNELRTDIKLVIAGDAQYEDKYKNMLYEKAEKNKRIIFTGFIHGELLEELFSNAYIYVLPSEIEGLPISLLEAMSYGNCCIASDIPENLEAINEYGYTYSNKNYKDLKRCLEGLIKTGKMIEARKQEEQRYVLNNYSWDNIAERFEELYYGMLKSQKVRKLRKLES